MKGIKSRAAGAARVPRLDAALRIGVVAGTLAVLVAAGGGARVEAKAPKETAAFGIALGATPDSVRKFFDSSYQSCNIAEFVYQNAPVENVRQTHTLAINPGLAAHDPASLSVCAYSPAGDDLTDALDARFVHPEVDRDQPLYFLEAFRLYPDVVHAEPPRLQTSFDEVRAKLFRTYGKPIDERRERITSSAANMIKSLGIGKKVEREDYLVRYLWATEGRLADVEREGVGCDCAGRYVKAVIEISRSPSTRPRNKFYPLSLKLIVEDSDLRGRQADWDAQWQKQKP
jgi:hypothetical protein